MNFNRPQDDGTHFSYATNRIKYAADNFTVTNVFGYLYSNEVEGGDIDGSGLDLFYEGESIKRSSVSEELRIQSVPAAGRPFDWTGGFYYGHDYGHVTQYTYAGSAGGALFGVPEGTELTSSLGDSSDFSEPCSAKSSGMPHRPLSFTLGARYTHENVSNDGYNTSGTQVLNYVNGSASFNNFSPRFTAFYAIDNQTNLYATISRGFKAGGVEAQPVAAGGNQVYKPETLWNYEFGVKSESADKRLRLDADVFLMNWKDIQADYSIGEVSGGGVSFITGVANAASARSYGFETEATALVATGLTVGAGAGYDRAYYVSFPNAESGLGTTGDLSGATLPNSPKWTLHADSQYTHNFTPSSPASCGSSGTTRAASSPTRTPSSTPDSRGTCPRTICGTCGRDIHARNWTVTAFDENFLNKKYYTNAYEKAFVDGMFIEPGYRNIGVRVTVRTR